MEMNKFLVYQCTSSTPPNLETKSSCGSTIFYETSPASNPTPKFAIFEKKARKCTNIKWPKSSFSSCSRQLAGWVEMFSNFYFWEVSTLIIDIGRNVSNVTVPCIFDRKSSQISFLQFLLQGKNPVRPYRAALEVISTSEKN